MMDEDAGSRRKGHAIGHLDDLAYRLVPQRDGRLSLHVPIHDLARAEAARGDANEHFAPFERGQGEILEAQLVGGMVHRGGGRGRSHHTHAPPSGTIAYFAPAPRSRS